MSPKTTTLNQTTRRGATVHVDGRSAAIRLFAICLSIEVVFVLLDYFVNYRRFSSSTTLLRLTTITREDALATWFSSTQTLFVGLTAWLFWLGTRRTNAARWRQAGWCLVALFFTYVAIVPDVLVASRVRAAAGHRRAAVGVLSMVVAGDARQDTARHQLSIAIDGG